MKKTLKIVLGVTVVLGLGLIVFIVFNWDSVEILTGTEDLGVQPQAIPEVAQATQSLRDRGEADWPCWRGVRGDARIAVVGILKDWSRGLRQIGEVNYLSQGQASATWSAPVIRGDRLVVCGRDEGHDLIFCLNATDGTLLWQNQYAATASTEHGTGMRTTPNIEGSHYFTKGASTQERPGPFFTPGFPGAFSPLLT